MTKNEQPTNNPTQSGECLGKEKSGIRVTLDHNKTHLNFDPASTVELRPGFTFLGIRLLKPTVLIYPEDGSDDPPTKVIGVEKLEAVYTSDMISGGKLVEEVTTETLWEDA